MAVIIWFSLIALKMMNQHCICSWIALLQFSNGRKSMHGLEWLWMELMAQQQKNSVSSIESLKEGLKVDLVDSNGFQYVGWFGSLEITC